MNIVKTVNFDELLIESFKYSTSSIPFKLLSRVKVEGKEKALDEILTEVYDTSFPFIEDIFNYFIAAKSYLETKLFNDLRILSAREIFDLDDDVSLKWPSGFVTRIQALDKFGSLLIENDLDGNTIWLTPEEMIKKGITFKDGSPLYVSKTDKVFGVEVHKKKD